MQGFHFRQVFLSIFIRVIVRFWEDSMRNQLGKDCIKSFLLNGGNVEDFEIKNN